MKLIVGLGNPGRTYAETRHNVGWWLVNHLADVWRFDGWRKDIDALIADGRVGAERVRLLKPQAYMNLSGIALRPYRRRESWNPASDLLVVVDDVALPTGRCRMRTKGSSGGHNGLKSVEGELRSRDYARLRIGIDSQPGSPREIGLSNYVLDRVTKSDKAAILELFPMLVDGIELWLAGTPAKAMTLINRRDTASDEDQSPDESA